MLSALYLIVNWIIRYGGFCYDVRWISTVLDIWSVNRSW